MKQLIRLDEPESFFKNEKKIEFYKDLRDSNGKIIHPEKFIKDASFNEILSLYNFDKELRSI